jgi:anthranilate phosphoribosyltransferase
MTRDGADPRTDRDPDAAKEGEAGAAALMRALLDGELAAARIDLLLRRHRARPPQVAELVGYMRALDAHAGRLAPPPDRPRPVVLPAYGATRRQRNLTALVALLLKRYGVAVLVHGMPADERSAASTVGGPVTTAEVLRELDVLPAASLADAQARLRREGIAFAPTEVLAPGLARLVRADAPAQGEGIAVWLARLVDPFAGDGYRVICAARPDVTAALRGYLAATRADALLVGNTEGEPFAESAGTRIEPFVAGVASAEADERPDDSAALPPLPAAATAAWIEEVQAGALPVPAPVLAQLGACLAGVRR